MSMRVLVIGSGGREHAIVQALHESPSVGKIFCAPGNAGMEVQAARVPIAADDIDGLLAFALHEKIDLTVVGPEQPLVLGLADRFRAKGVRVFGPSAAAARLEGSKAFAKEFMARHNIPTAAYRAFRSSEAGSVPAFVRSLRIPVVVKADGLAAGKGVVICGTHAEAESAAASMLSGKAFGEAGATVVVEEYLEGEEASLLVLSDGERYAMLVPAQDHKRVFDNDEGKNTGGMGAYAPAPVMTNELLATVEKSIVRPTLDGMRKEGAPYAGCLYVGLMLTADGPRVLEYNCRFGDPETQVVVPLIDGDLAAILDAVARGSLDPSAVRIKDRSAVCVVLSSAGYPDAYENGKPISGLGSITGLSDIRVFHAGTSKAEQSFVTSGGRVLGITALGPRDDIAQTIRTAYQAVEKVRFDGAHYRKDIGARAVRRAKGPQTTKGAS